MKILAIEFSSTQRSVAVLNRTSATALLVSEVIETGERLTPAFGLIEQALQQAQLEREQIELLALGIGPGSYTGIRAAIALAQGWHLARKTKVVPISSALCLATQARQEKLSGKIHVVIDAQRGEFYHSAYEIGNDRVQEVAPLRLAAGREIEALEASGEPMVGGPELSRFRNARLLFPRASGVARLASQGAEAVDPERIEPVYLREPSFVKAPPPRTLPT